MVETQVETNQTKDCKKRRTHTHSPILSSFSTSYICCCKITCVNSSCQTNCSSIDPTNVIFFECEEIISLDFIKKKIEKKKEYSMKKVLIYVRLTYNINILIVETITQSFF